MWSTSTAAMSGWAMVPGGQSSIGENLFICQASTGVTGRYQASTGTCYCPFGGLEIPYLVFQCLYYQNATTTTSKSIRVDEFPELTLTYFN